MGAATSIISDNENALKNYVNAVAAKYILTQNFQDFISLKNPKNCSNLVILTSKIISKYLDNNFSYENTYFVSIFIYTELFNK